MVDGIVKGEKRHIDSFHIKGAAYLELQKGYTRDHAYITRKEGDWLIFCLRPGMPCLQKFIDRRRSELAYKRKHNFEAYESERDRRSREYLSEQAAREHEQRVIDGIDTT